jgi:hypothetical protein
MNHSNKKNIIQWVSLVTISITIAPLIVLFIHSDNIDKEGTAAKILEWGVTHLGRHFYILWMLAILLFMGL